MPDQPRSESRISALEKRASTLEAQVEELSNDTSEEFRALRSEIKQGHLDIGNTRLMQEIAGLATKEDIKWLATKAEVAEVHKHVARVEGKLDEVLSLLKKGGENE